MKVAMMSFAHVHAAGYARMLQATPGVELLTCDPDRDSSPPGELRGAEMAASLGVDFVTSYEELFAWGPDAVVIFSENVRHRRDAEMAAAHGAHVLCEKPLATSVTDAQAIVAACERAGVLLMTAYPVHFAPSVELAREALAAGQIGSALAAVGTNNGYCPVGVRAWFLDPKWSGGGCLVDHTVHVSELLDYLTGARAVSVTAVSNQILHTDLDGVHAETGGMVTISYDTGLVATIDCSWSVPQGAPVWGGLTLELMGTAGRIEIAPFEQHVSGWDRAENCREFWLAFSPDDDADLLRTFLAAVQARLDGIDVPSPAPDGAVGVRTAAIVAAAQESARTGRTVTVAPV